MHCVTTRPHLEPRAVKRAAVAPRVHQPQRAPHPRVRELDAQRVRVRLVVVHARRRRLRVPTKHTNTGAHV